MFVAMVERAQRLEQALRPLIAAAHPMRLQLNRLSIWMRQKRLQHPKVSGM